MCESASSTETDVLSVDIPHSSILRDPTVLTSAIPPQVNAYLLCRRGNDSLLDARIAKSKLQASGNVENKVFDLRGGLQAWSTLNPDFPCY